MVISIGQKHGLSFVLLYSAFPGFSWETHAYTCVHILHNLIIKLLKAINIYSKKKNITQILGKVRNSCCLYLEAFWKFHANTELLAIVDLPAWHSHQHNESFCHSEQESSPEEKLLAGVELIRICREACNHEDGVGLWERACLPSPSY